jgi:hypothetical protein
MESSQNPFVPFRPSFSFRFRLRNLLLATAVVGLAIAPAQWLGAAYLASIALSIGLVAGCVLAYRNTHPAAGFGLAVAGAFVGLPLAMAFIVFFVHAFLNAVLCLVFLPFPRWPRVYAVALILLVAGVYGQFVFHAVEVHREFVALRAANPLVSLRSRLAFEQSSPAADATPVAPPQLTPAVVEKLNALDEFQESRYFRRAWSLEQLHENFHQQFARATGFGISRMATVYPGRLELEPRQPIALPQNLMILSTEAPITELDGMHRDATYDFVDRDRMGYVRDRDAVAGFEPHGLSSLALLQGCPKKKRAHWQITRLELVGLLRHDEPVVYVTDSMPAMDELDGVPTRPLDDFETAALTTLAAQVDVVVDQRPERIRMLGALRAGNNCLQCHEGQRGKLLGAFSYEIVPRKSPAPPKKEVAAAEALTAQLE